MQVVLSATLSHLHCVLGDFHISTDTLVRNFPQVFWFLPLFQEITRTEWLKGARQSLPLQLGIERFHYISLQAMQFAEIKVSRLMCGPR